MSKKPSLKLFKLIKSMTPSEKRYFKLFASNHRPTDTNKYFQLFDAIDAQKEYNDEALKTFIYEGAAINSKNFPNLNLIFLIPFLKV